MPTFWSKISGGSLPALPGGGLSIASVRLASDAQWDGIWESCPYSTYFHSREWADIWTAYTGGGMRPAGRIVRFSDGKEALLPFSCRYVKRRFVPVYRKFYSSSPAGTFGGWLSVDAMEKGHASLLGRYIREGFPGLVMRLNPYEPLAHQAGFDGEPDETHSIDLTAGFESVVKGYNKGAGAAVKQAVREGVTVRAAESVEDWRAYYAVYEESLERWGDRASSSYDWTLFNAIYGKQSQNVRLWLGLKDEMIIAGALVFYSKNHSVYWHGAARSDFFSLRPVNLLIHEMVRDACLRGCGWFDLNPSGNHEGVKAFKTNLGARPLPCPVVRL